MYWIKNLYSLPSGTFRLTHDFTEKYYSPEEVGKILDTAITKVDKTFKEYFDSIKEVENVGS